MEEAFLVTRYEQMPRTMLRYAIEKFFTCRTQGVYRIIYEVPDEQLMIQIIKEAHRNTAFR